MGCTNCGGKVACDHRKGRMLDEVEATLARLYPTRRWGEPDDAARFRAGVTVRQGRALAAELAAELKCAALFREGESCLFIYLLCVGRRPCLAEGAVPEEQPVHEQYLRVCLSTMTRFAAVQQVALDLDGDVLTETPREGVYDPPLLPRLQKLVALLPAHDILHLDFGEIAAPPDGYDPGDYIDLYGIEPAVVNYLFYPHPAGTRSVRSVGASRSIVGP